MIDLNRQQKNQQKEEPLGVVILGVMPFILMLFWGLSAL